MSPARCWGIFRERAHSPGRETDDAEILRLTAKHLEARGFEVTLIVPEELDGALEGRPQFVFLMCERLEILGRLRALEQAGARMINSPSSVLNTYRARMIAQFREANVPFIESRLVSTSERDAIPRLPVWVKRADVHNTQDGDVSFATTADEFRAALLGLAARGIPQAVLQPHVAGDLIKFYGIGHGHRRDAGPSWFRCFYHRNQQIAGHPYDPKQLGRLVRSAGSALGLEIYGGDAIATATGDLVLLDVNAWPSFALYREEAAPAIAGHLALRLAGVRR